jgi:hypothetical protein
VAQANLALAAAMVWPVFWNSPTAGPGYGMGIFPFRAFLISPAERLWIA